MIDFVLDANMFKPLYKGLREQNLKKIMLFKDFLQII